MAQYPNIGGMLTSAGARQGQQLGGAFTGLTQNLMKPVDSMIARKKQEGAAKEVQDFLAANKDDPAALNAEAARYASMGNDAVARVFTEAAQAAVDRKSKAAGVKAAQGSVAAMASNDPKQLRAQAERLARIPGKEKEALELLKTAQTIEDTQNTGRTSRGRQGGLTAITQASSKLHNARLTKDAKAVQEAAAELKEAKGSVVALGGTAEEIRQAEEAGKVKKPEKPNKLEKVTKEIVENGVVNTYTIFYDPSTGTEVNRVLVGESEPEKGNREGDGRTQFTAGELRLIDDNNTLTYKANQREQETQRLLDEAIEFKEAGTLGIGGVLGQVRDFAIQDIAGLGTAVDIHKAKLNEVQFQRAVALLPPGPASDKDVALALNSSINPKNLNAEQRVSYLRGISKLAKIEAEYYRGKQEWITATEDPTAMGYEKQAKVDMNSNYVEGLRTENPEVTALLDEDLALAAEYAANGQQELAEAVLVSAREQDTIGYFDAIESRFSAEEDLAEYKQKKGYTF